MMTINSPDELLYTKMLRLQNSSNNSMSRHSSGLSRSLPPLSMPASSSGVVGVIVDTPTLSFPNDALNTRNGAAPQPLASSEGQAVAAIVKSSQPATLLKAVETSNCPPVDLRSDDSSTDDKESQVKQEQPLQQVAPLDNRPITEEELEKLRFVPPRPLPTFTGAFLKQQQNPPSQPVQQVPPLQPHFMLPPQRLQQPQAPPSPPSPPSHPPHDPQQATSSLSHLNAPGWKRQEEVLQPVEVQAPPVQQLQVQPPRAPITPTTPQPSKNLLGTYPFPPKFLQQSREAREKERMKREQEEREKEKGRADNEHKYDRRESHNSTHSSPITPATPQLSKNLLGTYPFPPSLLQVSHEAREKDRMTREQEEREKKEKEENDENEENEENEEEEEREREDNEHKYERYCRRLALERRCNDWLIESEERTRARDRSMPRRGRATPAAIIRAIGAAKTRSHSHDGRWNLLVHDPSRRSNWFYVVDDRAENVDDLSSIGDKKHESLCTNDSLVPKEKEEKLEVDSTKLVWQHGFVIRTFPGKDLYEYEIFTLFGRGYVKSRSNEEMGSFRVTFAILPNGEAIIRRSSYCTSFFTFNLRINKTIKISSTALVAYRHLEGTGNRLIWSDDIGLIEVTGKELGRHRRAICTMELLVEPLKLVWISMQSEHSEDRNRRIDPRAWQINSIHEQPEENGTFADSLDSRAWPRLAQRVDDLEWKMMSNDGVIHLRSKSFPDRLIHCKKDQWMRTYKDERSRRYRTIKFTAVMVPYEPHLGDRRKDHWQCLLLAPLPLVSNDTGDRIFNFRPLDALVDARTASLPEGWTKGSPAPYPVTPCDT